MEAAARHMDKFVPYQQVELETELQALILPLQNVLGSPVIERTEYQTDNTDDNTKNGRQNEELVNSIYWGGELNDDEKLWPEACRFFLHDVANITQGVRLPGLRLQSRNYQMLDVYKMLRACTLNEFNGTFNCSKPGLGKTFEVLMTAATVALAHMSRDHVYQYPEAHKGHIEGSGCNLGNPFGIECYCIPSSLTRRIVRAVRRAPQLVVAPAGIVKQWAKEWVKVMDKDVHLGDDFIVPGPLVRMAWIENQSLKTVEADRSRELTLDDFLASPYYFGVIPSPIELRKDFVKRNDKKKRAGQTTTEATTTTTQIFDHDFYKSSLSEARRIGQNFSCVPKQTATTEDGIGRERLLLVCSSSVISQGTFDTFFKRNIQVDQENRKRKKSWTLTRCFVPSALYYDEWTEGKGKDTKIIEVMNDLCRPTETSGGSVRKPLVALLSGTPMPRGPKCLDGVLPLITRDPEVHAKVKDLVLLYQKAQATVDASNELSSDEYGNPPDSEIRVREWLSKLNEVLGACMFQRRYGMPFLSGTIPDPRPILKRYPPLFPSITAEQQTAMNQLVQTLKQRIHSLIGEDRAERHLERLKKTTEFQTAHRCAVIPGISALDSSVRDWLFGASSAGNLEDIYMRQALRRVIHQVECEQLKLLEQIVHCRGLQGDHGLVLSLAPSIAAVAAEWLKYRFGQSCIVVEIMATNPKPNQRAKVIADLKSKASQHDKRPIIVVSTYRLLAMGFDGLQTFANYLVKLGEPWTTKEIEQAEARIHRNGQVKETIVYGIHGAEGSIDWELVQKNGRNLHLLTEGKRGILRDFLVRKE